MKEISAKYRRIVTIEDGSVMGGLYGAVAEYVSACDRPLPVKAVGIPDRYISQGTQEELKQECGLTNDEIYAVFAAESKKICKKDEKVLEN